MMIKYKCDVLARLKQAGYSTYRIRQQKIFGEKTMQALRQYNFVTPDTIVRCSLLIGCRPDELAEYAPDDSDRAWLEAATIHKKGG